MDSRAAGRPGSQDFRAVAAHVLEHLHQTVGLDMWAVGRRLGDSWLVLSSFGADLEGVQFPWSSTLCARVNEGLASWATPDVDAVPVLVEAREELGLPLRSYVTVPMQGDDGSMLGTLWGAGLGTAGEDLLGCRREVEVMAEALASLLSAELRLEREARHREMAESDAQTDALTGLGNRRRWDQQLAAEEARCSRFGSPATVLTVDVDGLKVVNDRWGHEAGDALLRQLAAVLRRECRPEDVVARLGGDEFAVLLAETGLDQAQLVAERLLAAFEVAQVSASLGLAARGREGLAAAWREADAQMYEHKRSRTRVEPVQPAVEAPHDQPDHEQLVQELLALARRHTAADLAFIGRLEGEHRVLRAVHALQPAPVVAGQSDPLETTYCRHMLLGDLPHAVPDTAVDPVAATLPSTATVPIGAYLGVPLVLADGTLYGSLCCLSHLPNPRFDAAAVTFLSSVAASLSRLVSAEEHERERRRRVLTDIDAVLAHDGVRMVYQPVVDLSTGGICGVEALARFEDHSRSTAEWFDDAAQVERSAEMELRTARAALAESLGWATDLWLNLSPSVLVSPAAAGLFTGRDLSRLVVEISEQDQIADYVPLRRALAPLREQGLRIAVDYAGAGFYSLRHVLELSPDIIKLDVSLVRGLLSDPLRRSLVTALVAFATEAHAAVVAEGVESAEELDAVRRAGVLLGQGFHLGLPEPAAGHERRQATQSLPAPRPPMVVVS